MSLIIFCIKKFRLIYTKTMEDTPLNFLPNTVDISKIHTLLYHFPDGKVLRLEIKDIEQLETLKFEVGRYLDTSEFDGILHFYPHGNS